VDNTAGWHSRSKSPLSSGRHPLCWQGSYAAREDKAWLLCLDVPQIDSSAAQVLPPRFHARPRCAGKHFCRAHSVDVWPLLAVLCSHLFCVESLLPLPYHSSSNTTTTTAAEAATAATIVTHRARHTIDSRPTIDLLFCVPAT
jgi:hypothetical protein